MQEERETRSRERERAREPERDRERQAESEERIQQPPHYPSICQHPWFHVSVLLFVA